MNDRPEKKQGKELLEGGEKKNIYCFIYINSLSFERYPDGTQAGNLLLCKSAT